ncbi:hypothetical protein [Saccharopolyspora cebuensis]|uniref:MYXO-CTERM domain-containing protein n=1 Tax=Saccharopolyspora cebuensis TaxID=418759 RepID=A0ABV4CQC0_9PSEU
MIALILRVIAGAALVAVASSPETPPPWRAAAALTVLCGVLFVLGRSLLRRCRR